MEYHTNITEFSCSKRRESSPDVRRGDNLGSKGLLLGVCRPFLNTILETLHSSRRY